MDSGFAWIILLASTFNFTLYAGILRTFGVLYAELLQQYEDAAGKLAFASSLQIFMSAVAGMISGQTSIHFSFKWTTVIGGIIAAVGMATSSLAIHNWYLYLTYSLILGSGLGIMHTSGTTIINFYFEKKRALANGIFASGAGLSSLFFPTLYRKLFDKYGLRGGLLIVGGILLNICVAGFAFRQPFQFHKRTNLLGKDEAEEECSSNNESHQKLNKTLLKLTKIKHHLMKTLKVYKTVWTNKSFFLYFISFSFALVGNGGYLMILPSFLEGNHFSKEDVVIMLTVFGATDLVTRCPFGLMFDRKWLSVQTFYSAFMVIGGVVCIVMIHTDTLSMHYVLLILFSTFPGAIFHFRPLLIVNVGQLEDFPSVFALLNLVSNTAVLIALPILGMLEDLTGSWDSSLYACSASLFLAAILVILERILFGTNNRSSKTTDQEEESLD